MRADLAHALSAFRAPEDRPYRPHVTVARVRGGRRPSQLGDLPAPPGLRIVPEGLVLYRSTPAPGGTRYEAV